MGKKIGSFLDSIARVLEKIILTFDAVGMAALVLIITAQVLWRYVLNNSLTWSEELSKYITCYIIFLTTGYVLGTDQHVRIDLLYNRMGPKLKSYIDKFFIACYLFFSYIVTYYGFQYLDVGRLRTASSMIWLRMDWMYLCVPISGIIMAFYCLVLLFRKRGDCE